MTLRSWKKFALGAVVLFPLALVGCGGRESVQEPRLNLVLVTLDTLRADWVGCHGDPGARTPALDGLARRGVRFDQAYTPAPMTLPAHATLMTGLSPAQHGARVNGEHRLADQFPTLAQQLSGSGYRTGAFIAAFVLAEKFTRPSTSRVRIVNGSSTCVATSLARRWRQSA